MRHVPLSPDGWFILRFLSLGPHGGGDSIEFAKSLEVNFRLHWGCLDWGSLFSVVSPVLWARPKSTSLNIFFFRSYRKLAGLISPLLENVWFYTRVQIVWHGPKSGFTFGLKKIESHPCYPIICDWYQWGWKKKISIFQIFKFGIWWIQIMSFFKPTNSQYFFIKILGILRNWWIWKKYIFWIPPIQNSIFFSSPLSLVTNCEVAWMGLNSYQDKRESTFWPMSNNMHPIVQAVKCNFKQPIQFILTLMP